MLSQRQLAALAAQLDAGETFTVNDVDVFRLATTGHRLLGADNVMYNAPADFTVAIAGPSSLTLTWRSATPLLINTRPWLALAMYDGVMQTDVAGGSTQPVPVSEGGAPYEIIAAADTDEVAVGSGAAGDVLVSVRVRPTDSAAAGSVVIKDGATTIDTFTAAQIDAGERYRYYGLRALTNWNITTPADVSAIVAVKPGSET